LRIEQVGKKMAHKGFIEASFDPGLIFGGVHLANWVPGGNVTVRDVATTHLAVQAASGNVSVYGVDASSVIALAGAKQNRKRTEQNRTQKEENRTEQSRAEQNRTEQNRTEQNRTEQNRTENY
jgi:hypothetical protein